MSTARLMVALGLSVLVASASLSVTTPTSVVWINEFHYDNAGTDSNEFIEVVVPATYTVSDLAAISLVRYNGSSPAAAVPYTSPGSLTSLASFTQGATVGDFTFYYIDLPQDGLQNGGNDGIALSQSGTLLFYLTYEGVATASGSIADGQVSHDVGVAQTSTTPVNSSLHLVGSGNQYGDFSWAVSDGANTKGNLNTGQTLTAIGGGPPPPPPPVAGGPLIITGIVDATLPGGVPKFVELYASEDIADLSQFSVSIYNNGSGSPNTTNVLPGISLSAGEFFYLIGSTSETDFQTLFPGKNYAVLSSVSFNGDDAFQLLEGGNPLDVFGVIGVDGTGELWEYTDSYAFRLNGFGPNNTFTLSEWLFGGPNLLDPFGSDIGGLGNVLTPLVMQFQPSTVNVPEPITFSMILLGSASLLGRRRRSA